MVRFLNNLANTALVEESDSEDEIRRPTLRDNPQLIIVAHNGFKFDIPILLRACSYKNIPLIEIEKWRFVGTLHRVRSLEYGCVKPQ